MCSGQVTRARTLVEGLPEEEPRASIFFTTSIEPSSRTLPKTTWRSVAAEEEGTG